MPRNVIWGVGYFGKLCAIQLGIENIDFFIDSDRKKSGMLFGKKIITPDDVSSWDDLKLYIPMNYKTEICDRLRELGDVSQENISVYGSMANLPWHIAVQDYKRAIDELKTINFGEYYGGSVFWTKYWATERDYSKGYENFIKQRKMLVVSEIYWIDKITTEKALNNKAVVAPVFSACETVQIENSPIENALMDELKDELCVKTYSESVLETDNSIGINDAYCKAGLIYKFMDEILQRGRFKYAIINASDTPEHILLKKICSKHNVRTVFTHPAVIPGTLSFDNLGDVGDSTPAIYYREFLQLPITDDEISHAEQVWNYLYANKVNRKPQPKHDWFNAVKCKLRSDRPVVFFAGQYDLCCSMIPYNDESKKYHSPVFKSNYDALSYLSGICLKNDWNLVYKPHPMAASLEKKVLPDNVIYILSGDINDVVDFADVTVTIRSTVNYIALIRNKPVVMMGYTQTRGQGCTYEAFVKEEIEVQLKKALKDGFLGQQRKSFLEHIARLLKYSLYDDMSDRPIRYGKPFPLKIEEFFTLEERLKSISRGVGKQHNENLT